MSRGRLNIATCLVTGSIETVISVSVLWPPRCSSAPMSRMFSRSLPSHGGIVDARDRACPRSVGSGVGATGRFVGLVDRTGVRRATAMLSGSQPASLALVDEDAAAQRVLGEQVVAGDDDVGAGHDEHDGRSPAIDSGLRGSRARPRRPSPDAAWAFRYSVTR